VREAFTRHLHDGGPVDVPQRALSLPDALAVGRAANAAMSLAHPHLYDELGVSLLRKHATDGLGGVEACYGAYDARDRARWTRLADELGLVATGGSDWHGPEDASVQPGIDIPGDRGKALYDWLCDSNSR
jgi:predicted metal-dependent phosphoesterase TrpH